MADKKKIVGICAAVAAVAILIILIILLLRGCGGTRVESPTEPPETDLTTSAADATTEAAETEATEETTEPTEETTEATEETEPEETQGSSGGNSTPGGYNPDFGSDDEDEDDKEEEEPFAAPAAGVENNPYIEKLTEIPGQIDTVLIPVEGTVYYEIHGAANSVLTLENPDATIICGETTCTPDEAGVIRLPLGDGTEPVTIQLSNAAAAEAPYLLKFLGVPGSESNPEVLESIEQIPVNLAEGDQDGYHYVWPVTETGELTLQPQAEGYVITVTIGDTTVSSADSEDGLLTFEVEKDQEVVIHVIAEADEEGNYPAVTDTILGTLGDKGTVLNPYVRYLTEIPAEITTVEIPIEGQRIFYEIYGAGETILTIADPNAVVVYNSATFTPDENGILTIAFDILEPETPASLAIRCTGEEAKKFTMHFAYPEGSEKNPIPLETLDPVTVSLAGGGDNVRWYSWTSEKAGTVAVRIDSAVPETAVCGISLILADGTQTASDALETAASMEVEEGQTVLIRVETAPDEAGVYPAAEITFSGSFTLKPGLEENPIALTVPQGSITVPAGESLYFTAQAPGMNMTLTGENVTVLFEETEYTAEGGQIVIACGDEETQTFLITNRAEEDAVYSVSFEYPLGSEENPAQLALGENTAKPENGEGYRFTWTAEAGGQLTIASDAAWSYTIENLTNTEVAAISGSEASQMVEVAAGDTLRIIIESDTEAVSFTASFFDPTLGTEVNPIWLELSASEITLEAGETVYYRAKASGADMTLKGAAVSVTMGEEKFTLEEGILTVRCKAPEGEEAVVFAFTNEGEAEAVFEISFAYPAGSVQNPGQLILGENVAAAEAGADGYYFTWTAETGGELTLSVPEGTHWNCRIENVTAGSAEPSEGTEAARTVTVSEGDELLICVTPLDPENAGALPGGEIRFTAAFVDPTLGTEANPILMNVPQDTITVPAGGTTYYQARVGGMILTLTGNQVTIGYNGNEYAPENGQIVFACAETGPYVMPVFAVTNTGSEDAAYTVAFAWPEGHRENPVELTLEEITCTLEAGTEGRYFTWTAQEDGVLTITMAEDAQWSVCINNLTAEIYGDVQTSDGEITVLTAAVKAGEELQIVINTYNPANPDNAPAGTVEFAVSFKKTEN